MAGITGSKQLANQRVSALHVDSTVAALVVHAVDASGAYVSPGAGSTQVSIREILTAGGQSILDSTNNSLGVTIRAGSASGTEYTDGDVDATVSGTAILFDNSSNTLRPVTLTRGFPVNVVAGAAGGSTQVSVKEILTSSGGSVLDSTAVAVRVNQVGYVAPSTTISIANQPTVTVSGYSTIVSVANTVAITQAAYSTIVSVANTVAITQAAYSTIVSVANNVSVQPVAGSTWAVRPLQSSAADLQMTATPLAGSTWNVRPLQSSAADLHMTSVTQDGSSNNIESSTRAAGTNSTMRGLAVRSILPLMTSFASSNAFTSSAATIASSNAATIGYVYAYSITSTNQTPTKVGFYTGAGTLLWPVVLAAISSAVTGVNLAVSPPAYLFKGSTGTALTLNIPSSGVGWKVGVAYWTE